MPDSWARDACERNSRPSRGRRRRNIWPPVAVTFYNFSGVFPHNLHPNPDCILGWATSNWFLPIPLQPPVAFNVSRQRGHPPTVARSAAVVLQLFCPGKACLRGGADPNPRQVPVLLICSVLPLARHLRAHYGLQGGCNSCGASCNLLFRCPHWDADSRLRTVYESRATRLPHVSHHPADLRDRDLELRHTVCGFHFAAEKKEPHPLLVRPEVKEQSS